VGFSPSKVPVNWGNVPDTTVSFRMNTAAEYQQFDFLGQVMDPAQIDLANAPINESDDEELDGDTIRRMQLPNFRNKTLLIGHSQYFRR
jgi:hypothetical protein